MGALEGNGFNGSRNTDQFKASRKPHIDDDKAARRERRRYLEDWKSANESDNLTRAEYFEAIR